MNLQASVNLYLVEWRPQLKIRSVLGCPLFAFLVSVATPASAQVNSWTKPTSGFWHEPFWSLGILSDNSQSEIMFTNSGWKALAIDATTAGDFPASLRIQRMTVASPTNTVNTFMLNHAGVQSPLQIADSLYVG